MLESFQEAPNDRQVAFVIDFYRFMTAISINKPLDMIIVPKPWHCVRYGKFCSETDFTTYTQPI